jgi:GntR family transcriptional regulator
MIKISKNSTLPLYHQIKELIKEMIDKEELKPGDSVPSERDLSKIHAVSRMTANKAVSELVDEGILYREKGKGTFVAKPKQSQELEYLKSFTEEMKEKGLTSKTEILEFEIESIDYSLREKMKLGENVERTIRIKRLRMVEDEPFAIETVWIPLKYCPDLTKTRLEGKSLYNVLRTDYGHIPFYAKQAIKPIAVSKHEAEMLHIKKGDLALLFNRRTYLENEEIIEYTETINRVDRYEYEVVLKHL